MNAPAVASPPKPQVRPATEDTTVIRIIPELAARIGLNESVMLLQIAFWIGSPNTGKFIDDRWWTWQSIREMHEKAFSYWSLATINRTVTTLIQAGYIIEGNYNERKYDRTRWFALNLDNLAGLPGITVLLNSIPPVQNETRSNQSETRSTQNETHSAQNETTIPEKSSEITTEKSSEIKTTTELPVVNPESPAPEAVEPDSGCGYAVPALTEVDLWESATHGKLAQESDQPPEARAVLPSKPKTAGAVRHAPPPTPSPSGKPLVEQDTALGRIARAFEANIAGLVPTLSDELKDWHDTYPEGWIIEAISEAVLQNVRKPSYVRAILEKWCIKGKTSKSLPVVTSPDTSCLDEFFNLPKPDVPPVPAEPADSLWQQLCHVVETQSRTLFVDCMKKCSFGGFADGVLTIHAPNEKCGARLNHRRWLDNFCEVIWQDFKSVRFIIEGVT